MKLNQLEFNSNDNYKSNEKLTTNFEPSNLEDAVNKAHLDTQ